MREIAQTPHFFFYTKYDTMEKIDVEQVSFAGDDEAPRAETIEARNERAEVNTGIILTVHSDTISSLKLAKDGRVSIGLSRVCCAALMVDASRPFFTLSRPTMIAIRSTGQLGRSIPFS